MWTTFVLSPPTAFAMSARSVVLVTTLSWAWAAVGHARSAATSAKAKLRLFTVGISGSTPAAELRRGRVSSEGMWLVRTDGERCLEHDPIHVLAIYPRRHHA